MVAAVVAAVVGVVVVVGVGVAVGVLAVGWRPRKVNSILMRCAGWSAGTADYGLPDGA